jgi:hypothetical protein
LFSIQPNKNCHEEAEKIYEKYAGQSLTLDELAEVCLDTTRQVNLGLAQFPGKGIYSFEPFTVFTPIQGSYINPEQNIEGSEIHRMLEAVTTWKDPVKSLLPSLSLVSIQTNSSKPLRRGSLIYHHRRGIANWFPEPLIDTSKRRTLSCYHKNLVLASLQVESLSKLLVIASEDLRNYGHLSTRDYENCAKRAASILGLLYGGVQTYTSQSIQVQIEGNEWKNAIEVVRARLLRMAKPELHPGLY